MRHKNNKKSLITPNTADKSLIVSIHNLRLIFLPLPVTISIHSVLEHPRNKKKIINDPVYGLIGIRSALVFDLIEHPWMQRLRRIKQLGLSFLVYPGANHTRFEHALGALHLMRQAIESLRLKGHPITDEEADGAAIAILLHDIGHGPFSHTLEHTLLPLGHEEVSSLLMEALNRDHQGRLDTAISIFRGDYPKRFLHQMVSGQLDMDRLDYLTRDSFYTGVAEGVIGFDRIIKMLEIDNDQLVVEAKAVYSIEKFLIARRLMYWQVYLHKTVLAADALLTHILHRARKLATSGSELFASPSLMPFLTGNAEALPTETLLNHFVELDDTDILGSVKAWQNHSDPILSYLSSALIARRLFHAEILPEAPVVHQLEELTHLISSHFKVSQEDAAYFFSTHEVINNAYDGLTDSIQVVDKHLGRRDVREASDIDLAALTNPVRKFFIGYPKELRVNRFNSILAR